MSEYTVLIPKITAALFSPNPVDMNTTTKLTATVTEETVTLEPYYYYSAEIYAGEV